jgi:hypothetical protein
MCYHLKMLFRYVPGSSAQRVSGWLKLPKELEFLLLAYRMVIYTIRQGSEFRHHNNILPYLDMKHLLPDASQYK